MEELNKAIKLEPSSSLAYINKGTNMIFKTSSYLVFASKTRPSIC